MFSVISPFMPTVTYTIGKKPIGKYEVDFDASKISPGIYIYKLHAGSLELIKKMIIVQ